MFEGDDQINFDDEQPPEESGNKTFLIAAGILGGIILLSIACLAGYALLVLPRQAAQNVDQQATLVAQNVQMNTTLTALAQSDLLSQTPPATFTPTATNTPPIQAQPSATATVGIDDPQTATVAAAFTQAAAAQLTVTFLPTTTALPEGGFADEAGLPGLVIMTIALVVVILLARRLRTSTGAR